MFTNRNSLAKWKKFFLTCISRNNEKFENFCVNFDLLLSNINEEIPICSIITGDFNARSSNWWKNDITNSVGQKLDSLTSSAGYSQIIDEPTHIVNSSTSCIDLIFCTNTSVISKRGVDVSIFEKCHYNIIVGKTDIFVPLLHLISAKYGITARQMLKILKKQYPVLIGIKHLKIFQLMQKLNF